jgi:signal transduction histidine kinase
MWINHRKQMKEREVERIITKEQERQLRATAEQKNQLEILVAARTSEILQQKEELQETLNNLKDTQEQLIQQEKLASLGQLTAGIAHEIKNPLNFVNNFSELSLDFVEEIEEEMTKIPESPEKENILELLEDVKSNLGKIRHHGSRADSIVKSMLLHSRGGTGTKDPTDLNAMIREYANLAFHGMRANPNPINVEVQLHLDETLPKIDLNAEDFSRVILNLVKNAFDAMREKIAKMGSDYKAKVEIRTQDQGNTVLIQVEDNGPGVPDEIRDKLLMPFFTTKKGTEGTGLGLSITHDIIKSHEGSLSIESKVGEFTRFTILIPKSTL